MSVENFLRNKLTTQAARTGVNEFDELTGEGWINWLGRGALGVTEEEVRDKMAIVKVKEETDALSKDWKELNLGPFPTNLSNAAIYQQIKDARDKTPQSRLVEKQISNLGNDYKLGMAQIAANTAALKADKDYHRAELEARTQQNTADNLYRDKVRLDELIAAKANTELEREKMIWQNKLEDRKWEALQKEKDLARVDTLVSAIPQIAALFL